MRAKDAWGLAMVSGAGLAQAGVEGIVAMCPANAVGHLHIAAYGEGPVLQLLSAKSHASLTIPHNRGLFAVLVRARGACANTARSPEKSLPARSSVSSWGMTFLQQMLVGSALSSLEGQNYLQSLRTLT